MKRGSFRFRRMLRKLHEDIIREPIEPTPTERRIRETQPGEWERIQAIIKGRQNHEKTGL